MSTTHFLLTVAVVGVVIWLGRLSPLAGWRKLTVVMLRAAATALLCMALWGGMATRAHEVPRSVLYLVDRSDSMDEAQRIWTAARIASLESLRPRRVARAVVAFGAESHVVVPLGNEPLTDPRAIRALLERAEVSPRQTDLERALLSTLTLIPPRHPAGPVRTSSNGAGVILLSDGRETTGHVAGILGSIARLGLEAYPAAPPVVGPATTVWDSLTVSPTVQRGASALVQAVVFNGSPRAKTAQMTVTLQGLPITRQRVAVHPGWQVLRVPVPALQRGTLALEVQLEIPEDGLTERRRAYTQVEGPPQILFVTDRPSSLPALAGALKRREMDLAVARPSELPADPVGMLSYDAVVFFNIPKSSVTEAQARALRIYLERFGGGLVMVGLGGELADEISHPAPLDPLLPVVFEAKGLQESKRRVCFVLLIDRSASMLGPRIAATKRAAVELVKQLSPEDLVGVLAFDTQPYVVAEVQQAGAVDETLVEQLVRLRSSGGTDVLPALKAAQNRLELTGATLKHVILLSDGNTPVREEEYEQLMAAFRRGGISVSTIGVGSAFVNTEFLTWLARSTGGASYEMRNLDELPRLIAQDTQQALGRLPFTEGDLRPIRGVHSDWFAEIKEWPRLRGYLTTTAKPGAQTDLRVVAGETDSPLLARWALGQGRVAVFASDADTRWSPDWIRWSAFEPTWAGIVRWAIRPRLSEELFVWVDERRATPHVVIEGELTDPRGELLDADGDRVTPLSLAQTGAWRWQASLEPLPAGWYQLLLESRQDDASVFATRWIQVGNPRTAREATGQAPDEALLRKVAQATAGVFDAPDRAFVPPTTTATTAEPLFTWWLPLVILLFLVDIALRGSTML